MGSSGLNLQACFRQALFARWRRVFGLELVSVRVENESGIVIGSIMRSKAGSPLVHATELQCRSMEAVYGPAA